MRIQHNIMAMNAYRNYNINTKALSGNLEKLSSGYKINRAGDDAAGLAISEKMRAQITGLDAAQKNVKDGISLVKTAEGAMQEIQDMLNRMDYLATQSANGTYQDEVDRENLQKEVESLKSEINRIADSANFNGIKLLDGSISQREAGSKTSTVTGMDRILKPTLEAGEEANAVAGVTKTVLEEVGKATGTAGVIKIDLKALTLTYSGTASSSATAIAASATAFTIKIGDATISILASSTLTVGSLGTIAGLALKLGSDVAASASSTGTFITLDSDSGMEWYASLSNGVLTLTMKNAPTTASQAKTNFDVKVALGSSAATGVNVKYSTNVGVYTSTVPSIQGGGQAANTVFSINTSDIVDGAKITIGTTTITLAVGADSKIDTSSGNNVANLKTMDPDNIDLNTALQAISNAIGSTINAKGKNAAGEEGTTVFNVGVNDGKNGGPIGITIQATSAPSSASSMRFNTLEKLASIFSIQKTETWGKSDGLTLQIGDTADSFNQMKVNVGDMHTDAMGAGKDVNGKASTKTIADIDISTQAGAAEAVQVVKNAINYVSSIRGDLGAIQNRLDHTGNNLAVMAENIQDAESTIRDTDVADEMMKYVKNNILVQSAQAMLAQANQVPQGVLQLLG